MEPVVGSTFPLVAGQRREFVGSESDNNPASLHGNRTLDQIGVFRHQPQRDLPGRRVRFHPHLLVQDVPRIQERQMIPRTDESVQVRDTQSLVEVDQLEFGTLISQETPSLPTTRSTGLVVEANQGHPAILSRYASRA